MDEELNKLLDDIGDIAWNITTEEGSSSISQMNNKYLIGHDPINPINTSGGSRMLVYQERENNKVKKQKLIDLI